MAEVVLCHGIGYQYKHRETARTEWYSALSTGMTDAVVPVPSPEMVDAVYYGSCYRSLGGKSVHSAEDELDLVPPFASGDVHDPLELALLEEIASGLEPLRVGTKGAVQSALARLEASDRLGRPPARLVIWLVRQVRRYLDPEGTVRGCAQLRFERIVTRKTRVVIGHSLGSVVAYEALCAHPEWDIDTFITLGSPLGIRAINERLVPGSLADGGLPWPNVARWINIAADDDPVALVKKLAPTFGDRIEDQLIVNAGILRRLLFGGHSALRYLTASEVAEGVADALRTD